MGNLILCSLYSKGPLVFHINLLFKPFHEILRNSCSTNPYMHPRSLGNVSKLFCCILDLVTWFSTITTPTSIIIKVYSIVIPRWKIVESALSPSFPLLLPYIIKPMDGNIRRWKVSESYSIRWMLENKYESFFLRATYFFARPSQILIFASYPSPLICLCWYEIIQRCRRS